MTVVKIGHASISETGGVRGAAGDQTGKEVCIRNWYKHSKGWVTLRCFVTGMAEHIAYAMEVICADDDVGYDQPENQTLYKLLKANGFDIKNINKKVETDCARLVRVCVQYAVNKVGLSMTIPDFYTGTLANTLVKTGLFEKLTESKYNVQDDYLERGMIQVTKTKGHTWVILTDGDKAEKASEPTLNTITALGYRILRNGCEGEDVKVLQSYLIQLDYDCGKWGADGDFGDATELAVEKFQLDHGCAIDGEVGRETLAALEKALANEEATAPKRVKIVGGDCWVRSAPNTSGKKLGIVHVGERYDYAGETSENGWKRIKYKDHDAAWVSGKYSGLEV